MTGACAECTRLRLVIRLEGQEIAHAKRTLHRAEDDSQARLHQELRDRKEHLARTQARLDEHRASPDCTGQGTRTIADVRRRKPDPRERCPVCRRPVTPLPSGFLRKHTDPQGYPCGNRERDHDHERTATT